MNERDDQQQKRLHQQAERASRIDGPVTGRFLAMEERRLAERVLRFLSASMTQVTPDSQGRILLPKDLVQYAEIARDVVVVGCYDYAEIWAEESYSKLKENEDVEEMIRELESFGL